MFWVGARLASAAGHPLGSVEYATGQAFVSALQWFVHYSNELTDLDADTATSQTATRTAWSGGTGVLVAGAVSVRSARNTCLVLAFMVAIGLTAGAWLWSWQAWIVAAALTVVAGGYSAPPFYWQRRGFGPFATVLAVAVLLPGFAAALGDLAAAGRVVVLAPLWAWLWSMLLTIDLADRAGDEAAGKRTFVVRVGPAASRALAVTGILAGHGILFLASLPWWARAALAVLGAAHGVALLRTPDAGRWRLATWLATFHVVAGAAALALWADGLALHNP